jgi:malic enzyme
MTITEAISNNWGKITGAGAAIAATVGMLGKDMMREWWADYLKTRETKRQAILIAAQAGSSVQTELLSVMKTDVEARRTTDGKIFEVLDRQTRALEKQANACMNCSRQHGHFLTRIMTDQAAIREALMRRPQQNGG